MILMSQYISYQSDTAQISVPVVGLYQRHQFQSTDLALYWKFTARLFVKVATPATSMHHVEMLFLYYW